MEYLVHLLKCLSPEKVSLYTTHVFSSTYLVSGAMNQVQRPERKEKEPKKKNAPEPIFWIMGGVTRPMIKLLIQLEQVARATPLAR
jgi:hypothetical protein